MGVEYLCPVTFSCGRQKNRLAALKTKVFSVGVVKSLNAFTETRDKTFYPTLKRSQYVELFDLIGFRPSRGSRTGPLVPFTAVRNGLLIRPSNEIERAQTEGKRKRTGSVFRQTRRPAFAVRTEDTLKMGTSQRSRDWELTRRSQAGDTEAFGALVMAHW
jgi:hypothetical protein